MVSIINFYISCAIHWFSYICNNILYINMFEKQNYFIKLSQNNDIKLSMYAYRFDKFILSDPWRKTTVSWPSSPLTFLDSWSLTVSHCV